MLTLLALPMQTAAHTQIGHIGDLRGGTPSGAGEQILGHATAPIDSLGNVISPGDIIQWIRVYKNPLRVPVKDIPIKVFTNGITQITPTLSVAPGLPNHVYDLSGYGFDRHPYFMPMSYEISDPEIFWVRFDADTGDLFEDPDKPGKSGLVTATNHTSVKVGDIVAIAVNIKSWGGMCVANLAIGPETTVTYGPGHASSEGIERQWRLYPNMPLLNFAHTYQWDRNRGHVIISGQTPVTRVGASHTLVYQFEVTPDHAWLNTDGPWLKFRFQTTSDIKDITRLPVDEGALGTVLTQWDAFDWLWDEEKDVLPSPTTVSPFNTFVRSKRFQEDWGVQSRLGGGADSWGLLDARSKQEQHRTQTNHQVFYIRTRGQGPHRHIPMYDPALSGKEHIFYPKIEVADTPATTAIEVPGGTQTGAFTVTLSFADESGLFEGHDFSKSVPALTAAVQTEDAPWTVTSVTPAVRVASSGEAVIEHGESTAYTLTLVPRLGEKGALPLQIPADTVMDAAETGNLAASVTVEVDTSLKLAAGEEMEIPAPAAGAYLADDVIEVLVPFAQDGLTYEGDNPPYLTIYLGEGTENPRHATWQQGEESAGSTLVPFRYTIDAADPIAESVRVGDEGLLIPEGTTLMNGAGLSRVGADPVPKASGEAPDSSPPKPMAERVQILTPAGAPLPDSQTETQVTVLPTPPVYLPPDDSAPKAGMSSIPRSPIVFNELGNGSGDTNDWLELRNVTGDAVSLKDWELSVVQDGKKEDTSLVVFPDVSVPANGLLLLTNQPSDKTLLAGGDDIAVSDEKKKGLSHLTLVNDKLSLPDDGQFLLILRNVKEKRGLNEAFVDVAGGGGSGTDAFVREQEGDYDTYVWPLQVLEAPGSATEDSLSSGKVWLRAKADIVGYHRDAWAEAAFTGVGYDRKVSKSAETAGTPGYPNGAVKTEAPTPKGAITISEVMLDSAGGTLPQWVELYNASKTDALNLNRWELEIQNVDSEELVGRPIVRLTLQEKVIQPNQTLLIVTGNARASSADVYPADRVYNLLELHDKNLRIKKPSDTFLSARGFYLRLTDRNEHLVDEVGNTDGNRRTDDTPAWTLPVPLSAVEGMRSSLVRRYDNGVARDGKEKSSWALAANFNKFKVSELHYGHADDIGTPGYRQGGALPVELSSFTVTRIESGSVIVTWTTESEVDNAGFNLRRSLTRDGGFTLLNPALIAGAGTTGERQTYTFIDTSAKPGVEHYYQIEEVSFGGKAETLVTRRLRGPVSPAHRALKTLGEVKQAK